MGELERVVAVRTTRITVETETRMIVRRARTVRAWCPGCRAEVDVATLDDKSFPEAVSAAQVKEAIGSGNIHSWQTADGPARICVNSLLQCFRPAAARAFFHSGWNPFDRFRRKKK
jgi:hypothetical protein